MRRATCARYCAEEQRSASEGTPSVNALVTQYLRQADRQAVSQSGRQAGRQAGRQVGRMDNVISVELCSSSFIDVSLSVLVFVLVSLSQVFILARAFMLKKVRA